MDDPSVLPADPVISISPMVSIRRAIWEMACEMVGPIVEQHGLSKYTTTGHVLYSGSTFTEVEQHLNHIKELAHWLLGEEV